MIRWVQALSSRPLTSARVSVSGRHILTQPEYSLYSMMRPGRALLDGSVAFLMSKHTSRFG